MNTGLLVKNDVVLKAWNRVDRLAKARGLNRKEFIEWSKVEHYKSNISNYECDLITSYQVNKVIERLKINNKNMLAEAIKLEYSWVNRFKDVFNKVDKAIKHLQEVCEHMLQQEGREYEYKYLLGYDDVLFNRIIEGNEKKNKKNILIRKD